MDNSVKQLQIFELRRAIANLQQEYQIAIDRDLQFSIKKKIRLQIKDIENQLALLDDKVGFNSITDKKIFHWFNN